MSGVHDSTMSPAWAVNPLEVSYNSARFNRCLMSASSVSNDQVGGLPLLCARVMCFPVPAPGGVSSATSD